jgi:redox-sensitive bicupin YhaK (pirin superfamily)
MEAPRKGNGQDFDPNIPWRMYHGDKFPGFPQHPHRGFETLTATIDGLIDHTDSEGNAGRYGNGDHQWMTAGKGIVHGENFPLIYEEKPNHTRFFQIWLNLPSKDKMVDPDFVMHWAEDIKKIVSEDKLVCTTVFAGDIGGITGLPPPKNSWANNVSNEVTVLHITIKPGGVFTLPAAIGGKGINRMAYWIEGNKLSVNSDIIKDQCAITLDASISASFTNTNTESYTSESKKVSPLVTEILLLQGMPIKEPVVQHGPFVMNTNQEIQQAFADYRRTEFGGWPWADTAVVFPRFKGRFALQKGIEERPPNYVPITSEESGEILEELEPLSKDPIINEF